MASVYVPAPDRTPRVKIPAWLRREIADAYGWICHICYEPIDPDELHIDHVIPLARGGENTTDNLRPSHGRCNFAKARYAPGDVPNPTNTAYLNALARQWRESGRTTALVLATDHQQVVQAALATIYPPDTSDAQLIALWLHGRSPHTQRYYRAEAERCRTALQKPIAEWTLADLQSFADGLGYLSPGSRARSLSAVKSLLTFGHRLGILPVNVGGPLRLPKQKDTLAERILDEPDVQRMLALEPDVRNIAILRLLYAGGLRVSELCGLCWRDVKPRKDGCQLTIFGKGGKTRHILVSPGVWKALKALGIGQADEPLFRSRKGGHLDPSAVWRIVRAAARRAGIREDVSCHWLRHANASHALDRGCPIHVVQQTLGHASLSTTSKYVHARPNDSSGRYLAV